MRAWAAVLIGALLAGCSPPAAPAATVPVLSPTATAPVVPTPTATPVIVLEPRTASGDYYRGQADAPLTFEMFGDFQCPACGEYARSIEPALMRQYVDTGKVRYVWHDFPWIGDESFDAAQAARCAGRQGHFWAFHDYLYSHQRGENLGQFSRTNLLTFASAVGLEGQAFQTCLDGHEDATVLKQAVSAGVNQGVQVTPSFLLNGDLRVGAPPLNRLTGLLDFYLARVKS
jgi:protein-disulfide isomerase